MTEKMAILLAAGKGKRMKSDLPKVLFPVLGRPMIDYVLDALDRAGVDTVLVVTGHRGEAVRSALASRTNCRFIEQAEQLGTGHAVMCCRDELIGRDGPVFVIAGDSPMIRSESVAALFDAYENSPEPCSAVLGTAHKDNPFGMGRILRDDRGAFVGIVEERDATPAQKKITEINMSYYVFRIPDLLDALSDITTDNAQGEYYITDVPAILLRQGKKASALPILRSEESLGVNTPDDLSAVEAAMAKLQ